MSKRQDTVMGLHTLRVEMPRSNPRRSALKLAAYQLAYGVPAADVVKGYRSTLEKIISAQLPQPRKLP